MKIAITILIIAIIIVIIAQSQSPTIPTWSFDAPSNTLSINANISANSFTATKSAVPNFGVGKIVQFKSTVLAPGAYSTQELTIPITLNTNVPVAAIQGDIGPNFKPEVSLSSNNLVIIRIENISPTTQTLPACSVLVKVI